MSATPPASSTNPISSVPAKGHPLAFYFFFWGELAERCSFYGMNAILMLYMTDMLGFEKGTASAWNSYFIAACYLTPLFGGWVADRYLGKYWTIVAFSIPFILGNALMVVQGNVELLTILLPISLAIIAMGSGVIKPNISALMGLTYDQQRPGQEQLRSEAFTMFYWAINVGSLISQSCMPLLRDQVGPNNAFLLPTILMIVALSIFALGKRFYAVETPQKDNQLTPEEKRARWVVLFRLLGVFLLVSVFWSVFKHYSNVWVLFIRERIDTTIFGHQFAPDQFQPLNAFFILTLLPLASYLYKVLARRGINLRPTDKMQLGFLFTFLTPVIIILADQVAGAGKTSIIWVVLMFFCITVAEVLISPVGLELAFVAAPKSMKGFITACFLLTNFFGNLFNAQVTPLYSKEVDGAKLFTPTQYFGAQAGLALIALIAFYFVAIPFNRRMAGEPKTAS